MREERWRPNGTPAGSCTPRTPSGKEEEVYSEIARAAATIGRRACQSPGLEAEKRKEIRALAWKGGRRVEPAEPGGVGAGTAGRLAGRGCLRSRPLLSIIRLLIQGGIVCPGVPEPVPEERRG